MNDRYDDFPGPVLDTTKWAFLEMEVPGHERWRCEEPGATTRVDDGELRVRVDAFERSHGGVQIYDNPKHLLISTATFAVPSDRPVRFEAEMTCENLRSDPADFRDGFVTLNVLDMARGRVWDHGITQTRAFAIHEHLYVPGVVPKERSLSWFVENMIHLPAIDGTRFRRYAIELDRVAGRATWSVDGQTTFFVDAPIESDAVQLGLGLVTLRPIENGRSTSLRGQGIAAAWRSLRVHA